MRSPYPLQWPDGWKRATVYEPSRFGIGFAEARRRVLQELGRLGAANAVITSDLPTRVDGLPYANGRAEDPGIAVWFVLDQKERVFACDKWLTHAENLQAIAKSIEAMRGLDRWGASDIINRVFSGFTALPPGSDNHSTAKPWREVLGVTPNQTGLDVVRAHHRAKMMAAHPDRGGSHELAVELNTALADAERELGD
jgi:hypothetical protein